MDKTVRKIPKLHLNEFLKQQTDLIKSRLQLAAFLLMFCIAIADMISVVALGEKIDVTMRQTWMFSILLCAATYFLSRKIRVFQAAKISAMLFMIAVLAVMTKDSIGYQMPPFDVGIMFVFMFFAFSLIFPWSASEVIIISLSHFAAYITFLFEVPEYDFKGTLIAQSLQDYLGGLTILFLASIVCYAVIRRERSRDVENFILFKEIEEKNKQMQNELKLATRVHSRLIPHSTRTRLADIAVTYVPMSYMGGDYAKFYFIDKNKLIFFICDVTGHGVSAALLVNAINTEFERLAKEGKTPGGLLKEMDRFIVNDFAGTNMYLTAFCGLLDYSHFARKFIYSNYGHPPQYIYRITDSSIHKLSAQTSFLGLPITDEKVYESEIPFEKEDQILLFTDGVIEAKDTADKEYGGKRLEDFIKENNRLQVERFNQKLLGELNSFVENKLNDDVFILNIKTK